MSISYRELAERAGINAGYATQILDGTRTPSLSMAIKIYDATGLQFGILSGLPKETVEQLRPKAAA